MLTIFTNTSYDFIGKRRWAYALSLAVMLIGLTSIVVKGGLRYDIDFTGGGLVELRMPSPFASRKIRSRLDAIGLGDSIIQLFDNPRDVLIRTHLSQTTTTELSQRIIEALNPSGTAAPEVLRVDVVGPQIGAELRTQALYAVLAALGGILLYIWMRFDFRGGVVTIVSLAHDVFICVGALSLTNREISLPVLAALLTVIGFSVNDRIVMYDRLREIQAQTSRKGSTLAEKVNLAVNQTLSNGAHRRDRGDVGRRSVPVWRRIAPGLRLRDPRGVTDRDHLDGVRRGRSGRRLVGLVWTGSTETRRTGRVRALAARGSRGTRSAGDGPHRPGARTGRSLIVRVAEIPGEHEHQDLT